MQMFGSEKHQRHVAQEMDAYLCDALNTQLAVNIWAVCLNVLKRGPLNDNLLQFILKYKNYFPC